MNGSIEVWERYTTTTCCAAASARRRLCSGRCLSLHQLGKNMVERLGLLDIAQLANVANVIALAGVVGMLSPHRHASQRFGMFESCKEFF
jgi:hypothetical protein